MTASPPNRARVTGWVVTASVLLIVVGGINLINGYTALEHSSYYTSHLVYNNLTFWGWVFILWGGAQILAGVLAWTGRSSGNMIGIILAAAGSMLWFFMVWSEPWAAPGRCGAEPARPDLADRRRRARVRVSVTAGAGGMSPSALRQCSVSTSIVPAAAAAC